MYILDIKLFCLRWRTGAVSFRADSTLAIQIQNCLLIMEVVLERCATVSGLDGNVL
jgi:hypothetical protein